MDNKVGITARPARLRASDRPAPARSARPARRDLVWPLLGVLAALAAAPPARAEETGFAIERLRLTASSEGLIDVETTSTMGHMRSAVGLWMGFERDPLILRDISSGSRIGSLVERRWGGSLMGAMGVGSSIEVGLELPLVLRQKRPEGQPAISPAPLSALSSYGVGDLVVAPKLRLLPGLALQVAVSLPTGRSNYRGSTELLAQPEVLAQVKLGRLRGAINAGYRMRPHVTVMGQILADELTTRLGLGYRLGSGDHPRWEIAASLAGATSAKQPFGGSNQNALEAHSLLSYDVTESLSAFVGGGPGLRRGVGTPEWRIFAGTRLGPGAPVVALVDRDLHGQGAESPPCAPASGAWVGCPARDSDQDGLPDNADRCPQQKEDPDGYEDGDGCPDLDNDGDGIADAQDRCPNDTGPAANRGCPEPDRDHDGVADALDNCPDERGLRDLAGCRRNQLVTINRHEIALVEEIHFTPGSAQLSPAEHRVLDAVAEVILAHSEISQIRVEVRSSDVATARRKDAGRGRAAGPPGPGTLAQHRAEAVRSYLVKRGVFADRLVAQGLTVAPPLVASAGQPSVTAIPSPGRSLAFVIESGADPR